MVGMVTWGMGDALWTLVDSVNLMEIRWRFDGGKQVSYSLRISTEDEVGPS